MKFASGRNRKAVGFRFSLGNATTAAPISIPADYFNSERSFAGVTLDLVGDQDISLSIIIIEVVVRTDLHLTYTGLNQYT
jgi:hypothetical protein